MGILVVTEVCWINSELSGIACISICCGEDEGLAGEALSGNKLSG